MGQQQTTSATSATLFSREKHAALRFHVAASFTFAADWLHVPIYVQELAGLKQPLPILFFKDPSGALQPTLLLKNSRGSAVTPNGQWRGGYTPALLRLYPFGWLMQGHTAKLSVYPHAPHFSGKGEKLITSKGKPTQRMRAIMKQLEQIQRGFAAHKPLMAELQALDILRTVDVTTQQHGQQRVVKLLACLDSDASKDSKLSTPLRTLLSLHRHSLTSVLSAAASPDSEPSPDSVATSAANAKPSPQALVDKAIQAFGVSIEDLKSRKRAALIQNARVSLAADSAAAGCLDEVATLLGRSPDTLRKWC